MNYFIPLIAKLFVFSICQSQGLTLQNCWGRERELGGGFANPNVESVSESANLDEIQLHFSL